MKNYILAFITCLAAISVSAQKNIRVVNKNGYQLTLINQDATLDTALLTRMENTFFRVYPELAAA